MTRYLVGYAGVTMDRAQLLRWRHVTEMDPEFQRRVLACLDASIVAGRPLGIGSTVRTTEGQRRLFLSRHHEVKVGGCCSLDGKRWALNKGAAHAAPPGRSYHEDSATPDGKCLAIDWIGDLAWLKDNCARFGLNEFGARIYGSEPWHSQPSELPRPRRSWRPSMHPLKPWPLPGAEPPAPVKVLAPRPTIRQRRRNVKTEVRALQVACNFWRWRDAMGRTLVVDGFYGERSAQACMAMQAALGVPVDGVYGPVTARAFQAFLDAMAAPA